MCECVNGSLHKNQAQKQIVPYLCDLNTPVEQPLWAEFVLAVPDVLQQGALIAELGDDLQTVTKRDSQDPDDMHVVQTSNCRHVLQ